MSGVKVEGGTCEHRTVYDESNLPDGGIPCHRDASGTFEILSNGDVLAVMALCDECAMYLVDQPGIGNVRKRSERTDYQRNEDP